MNSRAFLVLVLAVSLLLSCPGRIRAQDEGELNKDYVEVIDPATFNETVKDHDFLVVVFYKEDESMSNKFMPIFSSAASLLALEGSVATMAKVEITNGTGKELAESLQISRVPFTLMFKGSMDYKLFSGPHDAMGMMRYLRRMETVPCPPLHETEEITSYLLQDGYLVMGLFESTESPEYEKFLKAAEKMIQQYPFRFTTNISLLPSDHPAPAKLPMVRVFKSFDDGYADTDDFDEDSLEEFIGKSTLPIVTEFGHTYKDSVFINRQYANDKKKVYVFVSYQLDNSAQYRFALYNKAKQQPKDMVFFYGNADANPDALKFFGLTKEDTPCIGAFDGKAGGAKYVRTEIEPLDIKEFVENLEAGTEPKQLRSSLLPEDNTGPVLEVNAKTFKKVVFNGKHVLLEFYSLTCGHCKQFEPTYTKIGEAFQNDPEIVVARIDQANNDYPQDKFVVEGVPKIFFCAANGDVVTFTGPRTEFEVISFVREQKARAAMFNGTESIEEVQETAELAAERAAADAGVTVGKDEL